MSFTRRSIPREAGDTVGYDARADVEFDLWITIPF
jgi:hypothetical protein